MYFNVVTEFQIHRNWYTSEVHNKMLIPGLPRETIFNYILYHFLKKKKSHIHLTTWARKYSTNLSFINSGAERT